MVSDEPLKLVLKCIDHEEFGNLYAFNKEITDEEKDLIIEYFRKYKPTDFKDIMNIEGNPHGWMCLEENVPKVEEKLGITETLEQQRIKNEQLQKDKKEYRIGIIERKDI
mgnify:CR=1 FL=1